MNGFEKAHPAKIQTIKDTAFALLNQPTGIAGLRMDTPKGRRLQKQPFFKYFHSKES